MADSDEPDLHEDYDISVKVPEDVDSDGVHAYLRRLAENINESEDVAVDHDDSTGLRRDSSGTVGRRHDDRLPRLWHQEG